MLAINVPQATKGMKTATVTRWMKRAGEPVATGDSIVELETEDSFVHLQAGNDGTLVEISAEPGKTLAVGGRLGGLDAAAVASATPSAPQAPTPITPPSGGAASGDPSKVVPVLMPQAGNTMEEGTVLEWRVAEGDQIAVGQVICEIETDKATMEFEAPDAGRLARIVAGADTTVLVKEPIALLAEDDADADAYLATQTSGAGAATAGAATAAAPQQVMAASAASTAPAPTTDGQRIKASPAARRLAAERGLDLASLGAGSGPGGRILSTDLDRAKPAAATAAPTAAALPDGAVRKPMSKMRRAIAANLTASKQSIPHFYCSRTINAGAMFDFYRSQKPATGCTINDVITLTCGRVIAEIPAFRSQIQERDLIEFPHANIGIAVGIDEGLVVPVVLGVEKRSLADLAAETKRVVELARNGRLEGVGKGVFTITNLGMFGVDDFAAIINPPEAAILAVSALREEMIVKDGQATPGKVMTMTLSTDHRIIDGVTGAQFLARLKEILEDPQQLAG